MQPPARRATSSCSSRYWVASNYTFCEATLTQQLPDFVASNIRALEYWGAVLEIVVPDQLRSAIRGPDRYDPDINRTF